MKQAIYKLVFNEFTKQQQKKSFSHTHRFPFICNLIKIKPKTISNCHDFPIF